MKYFIVFIATCVAAVNSAFPLQQVRAVALQQDDKCQSVETECKNCTHISLCVVIGSPPIEVPCVGGQPYCKDGACSSKPSSECSGGISSGFNCPATDGHYPDPNNCKLYHICVNKTASDYNCEGNSVYSSTTHSCVRQSIQSPCSIVNCKGKSGQYAQYPADHRYAFFCLAGETTSIMAKCEVDQEYDIEINRCRPYCTREGILPDPENKKNFVECTLGLGLNYVMTKRQCPNTDQTKSEFDPVTLECVLSKK